MIWRLTMSAMALVLGLAACGGNEEKKDPVAGPPICGEEELLCGAGCVDTQTDPRHCGGCDVACGDEEACAAGVCVLSCPAEQDECGGGCFDLQTSDDNCGACGNSCGVGETCVEASCAAACPAGQELCDGACTTLDTDADHCGACGIACGAGEVCADGACLTSCPAGQEDCDGGCFSLEETRQHCGACGTTCAAGEVCVDGACATTCAAGQTECDGTCRILETDRDHCGSCGNSCAADERCVTGACELHCASGLSECDETCRDLQGDRNNCGACGTACGDGEICEAGSCVPTCGDFAADLCEGQCTNTGTDPLNCGACGNACSPGEVCSGGACAGTCAEGMDTCGGSCTSSQRDPANCGACSTTCDAAGNAAAVCATGSCDNVCLTGYGDCDADLASSGTNGCETTLATAVDHCGACGNACEAPDNGTASCIAGACGLGQCDAGFDNCDTLVANGCEVDLMNDAANCGACGAACMAGQVCSAGTCATPAAGENCLDPAEIYAGINIVSNTATMLEYVTSSPSCGASYAPDGGDVVLQYDSAINGAVEIVIDKPASNRWHAVVSDGTCGSISPELVCASEYTATALRFDFPVSAGSSYFIYLVDSTSGTEPLSNPLVMQVSETNCASHTPGVTLSPRDGGFTSSPTPTFQATFDWPINAATGSVTITGTLGTSLTYTLPAPEVTLSSDGRTLTIAPGISFPAGEQLSIGWSGLSDTLCGSPVAAASWTVGVPAASCSPGTGGVVGTTATRVSTGLIGSFTSEYYVVADSDPNGWVYVGGTSSLFRFAKGGNGAQNVHLAAGIGSDHLGYDLLVDGQNVYTTNSVTSGTTGHVYRISTDGGTTWNVQDFVSFPVEPEDDIHSMAAHGGTLFMLTGESSSTVATQIWAAPTTGTVPVTADLVREFGQGSYTYCSGLAVDASYFYTTCRQGTSGTNYAVIRIDRGDGTITELATGLPGNTTNMAVHVRDLDADGIADVLYRKESDEEAHYVCSPASAAYVGQHFSYGTGTSDYGLGFDPVANVLWSYDDATMELMRIE